MSLCRTRRKEDRAATDVTAIFRVEGCGERIALGSQFYDLASELEADELRGYTQPQTSSGDLVVVLELSI